MKISRISTVITDVAIILFWCLIILLFLFFPRIIDLVYTPHSLNIFTFPRSVDVHMLSEFEQATGIKIYVSYYENNDELLIKMKQTKGEGYDLIFPSDYAVQTLIKDELLQPLDKNKMPWIKNIHSRLRGNYYDPGDMYSIAYLWGIYGIGIDTKFFGDQKPSASWDAIFNEHKIFYTIGMTNNAREAILLAAFYLFGTIDNLSEIQLERVRQLLLEQKKWVQTYTDIAPDYLLLSGSCPVVASLNNEIWQAHKYDATIEFLIPKEGTFIVIDTIAIPATSKKTEDIYKLLEFLYTPRVIKHHIERYATLPPLVNDELLQTREAQLFTVLDTLPKIDFFRTTISEKAFQNIWLSLKASP